MDLGRDTFKILSIDGGGIKGLYSATVLRNFEEQFDCRISDQFDMLCGTSTGGLIALALSLKIPAADIVEFYLKEGENIFPQYGGNQLTHWAWGKFRQLIWKGKFDDKSLRLALKKVFGEKVLGESHNLLCIPCYNLTDARPWIFKFDHTEGKLGRHNSTCYLDVALATSAAPTYFPVAEIEHHNKQFIDGGVYANNPTLVGFLEALNYFVGKDKAYQKMSVLSISSLTPAGGIKAGKKRNRSFLDWRDPLFDTFMTGQCLFTEYFMDRMNHVNDLSVDYLRIPSPAISAEQTEQIQLDVATKEALKLLVSIGESQGQMFRRKPELAQFFMYPKNYKIR